MDTVQVAMEVEVAATHQMTCHQAILEVEDIQEIVIRMNGDLVRIIEEIMIGGRHHQMPIPSAPFGHSYVF